MHSIIFHSTGRKKTANIGPSSFTQPENQVKAVILIQDHQAGRALKAPQGRAIKQMEQIKHRIMISTILPPELMTSHVYNNNKNKQGRLRAGVGMLCLTHMIIIAFACLLLELHELCELLSCCIETGVAIL